jgi:hypothetical protein
VDTVYNEGQVYMTATQTFCVVKGFSLLAYEKEVSSSGFDGEVNGSYDDSVTALLLLDGCISPTSQGA